MVLHALTWTLLHSIWWCFLLTGLVQVLFHLFPFLRPSQRYRILLLAGLLFFCGLVLFFLGDLGYVGSPVPTAGNNRLCAHLFSAIPIQGWVFLLRVLLSAWLSFFVFRIAYFVNGVIRAEGISNRSTIIPHHLQRYLFSHVLFRYSYEKLPLLRMHHGSSGPQLAGLFRPVVLFPRHLLTELTPGQAQAILLHELAHFYRHDIAVNFIQALGEVFFFFNPGFRWLNHQIRKEREFCCDDWAISRQAQPLELVKALVTSYRYHMPEDSIRFSAPDNYVLERAQRVAGEFPSVKIKRLKELFLHWSFCLGTFIVINVASQKTGGDLGTTPHLMEKRAE